MVRAQKFVVEKPKRRVALIERPRKKRRCRSSSTHRTLGPRQARWSALERLRHLVGRRPLRWQPRRTLKLSEQYFTENVERHRCNGRVVPEFRR